MRAASLPCGDGPRTLVSRLTEYASLADVYEFLTPEALLTPEGNVAAFEPWIDPLAQSARVLDCACGIGLLATGLALRGLQAHASDLSPDMVRRTRATAARHGVELPARVCAWEDLAPEPVYDAVFCVGNSLAHARDRVAALRAMTATLKPGGLLLVTSRNWDREQDDPPYDVERHGRRARVTYAWSATAVEITVTLDDGSVVQESLTPWPFGHGDLREELQETGLVVEQDTWTIEASRYLVAARKLTST